MKKTDETKTSLRGFISDARAGKLATEEAAGRTLEYNRTWRAKMQEQTGANSKPHRSMGGYRTWEPWEFEILRRDGLSVKEKALLLRRTYESTRNKLYRKDRWPEAERP